MRPGQRKGARFELLKLFLAQDLAPPIPEILVPGALVATILVCRFVGVGSGMSASAVVVQLVTLASFFPLTVFTMLMLRNLSFGFGQSLKSGEWATYLSFPRSRRSLFWQRIASALVVPAALYVLVVLLGVLVSIPSAFSLEPYIVMLAIVGTLQPAILSTAFTALIALAARDAGSALFGGLTILIALQTLAQFSAAAALDPSGPIALMLDSLRPNSALLLFSQSSVVGQLHRFAGAVAGGFGVMMGVILMTQRVFERSTPV